MQPDNKRPLRTYGRCTRSNAIPNTPTKRQRAEGPTRMPDGNQVQSSRLSQPGGQNRISIPSFFKPLKSNSDYPAPSPQPTSVLKSEPILTPSPLLYAQPRKRRRLTTRPNADSQYVTDITGPRLDNAFPEVDNEAPREASAYRAPPLQQSQAEWESSNGRKGERTLGERRGTGCAEEAQGALRDAKPSSLNRKAMLRQDGEGAKSRWRVNRARIQTTLSLSIELEPRFRVCTDCNMLYNPFNGKDRRDHERQHTAWERQRSVD